MKVARETFALGPAVAEEFAYNSVGSVEDGYPFPWKEISDEIVDQTRWQTWHWKVIQDTDSGRFWGIGYGHGSTEVQEGNDHYDDFLTRVWPHPSTEYREYPPEDAP